MEDIVKTLKDLDLSTKPVNKIKEQLNKLGKLGFVTTTIEKGKIIDRAVNNTINESVFNKKDRISYTPLQFISDYQRATVPNSKAGTNDGFTVFYGGILPDNISGGEIANARIIVAAEACPLIRNAEPEKKEDFITFGKWQVKENLNMLVIIDPTKQYKLDSLNALVKLYNEDLDKSDEAIKNRTQLFLNFISDEFAKIVSPEEKYKYIISAHFTQLELNQFPNIDGIIYPSVQVGGDGLCVAIKPSSMNKLELIKVLQCKAIKDNKQVTLENIRYCDVNPPNSDFVLGDIKTIQN